MARDLFSHKKIRDTDSTTPNSSTDQSEPSPPSAPIEVTTNGTSPGPAPIEVTTNGTSPGPAPIEVTTNGTSPGAVHIELVPDDQIITIHSFLPEELKKDPLVNNILLKTATETINEWLQSLQSLSGSPERRHAAAITHLFHAECCFLRNLLAEKSPQIESHYFRHNTHLRLEHINLIKLIHHMLAHQPRGKWWMKHFAIKQLTHPEIQSALSVCLLSGNPITSSLLEDIKNNPGLVVLMHFIAQFESTTSGVHQHLTRLRQQLEHMTPSQQYRFKTSLEVLTKDGVPESTLKVISHALLFEIGLRQHWRQEEFVSIGTALSKNKPARDLAYTINKLHRSACWCLKKEREEQLQHLFTFVDAAMSLLLIHQPTLLSSVQKETYNEAVHTYLLALENAQKEQSGHEKRTHAIAAIHLMMTEQGFLSSSTSQQSTDCERTAATALLLSHAGAEETRQQCFIPLTTATLPQGLPPLTFSETPRKAPQTPRKAPPQQRHPQTAFPSLVFDHNQPPPEKENDASSIFPRVG